MADVQAASISAPGVSYTVGVFSSAIMSLGALALYNSSTASSPHTVRILGVGLCGVGALHFPFTFLPVQRRQVHKWIRTRYFRTKAKLFERVATPKLIAAVTGLIAAYNSAETFWGNTSAFTSHPHLHYWAKITAWATLIVVAVLSFFRERWKEQSLAETETLFKDFVEFVALIVQQKLNRYSEKAKSLPTGKKFDHVVHPKDQIVTIFSESAKFLRKTFKLSEDQVDFTILERHNGSAWMYFAQHQRWNHTAPAELFAGASCAAEVIRTGQAVFHPSKKLAAMEQEYHKGPRDRDEEDGSIYCFPVTVECPSGKWEFVVSIVTYEQRFCDPFDEANQLKTKFFLREIVRRIEVELHLRAMKSK